MEDYCNHVNHTSLISEPKTHKLIFSTGVASSVFTGKKIRGEESDGSESIIDVILVDSQTNNIVIDGPFASKRVRMVLLPGDFNSVWTSLEFGNSIIENWKNKKNILQGDLSFNLEHGRGTVGKIWIKHDKNYLSKSKFRLGAMIDDCSYKIKEAITDPFEAKDCRNELISKNQPVTLADKVSRLKNVGRKGPVFKRLESEKIMTVKDFLDKLSSNPLALQKIYGSNGKRWDVTVHHAKTSIYDKKCNVCGSVGSTTQERASVSMVDHNGCTELEVESLEASPSSNYVMSMAFDQFNILDQSLELFDEVSYLDLLTNIEQL